MIKLAMNSRLTTNASVKIYFDDDKWIINNLLSKTTLETDYKTAIILISFMNGSTIENTYSIFSYYFSIQTEDYLKFVEKLLEADFLQAEDNASNMWVKKVLTDWNRYGWRKAADYHILTYDYPFWDYKQGGREADREIMEEYAKKEKDFNRGKKYKNIEKEINTPSPISILKKFDTPFKMSYKKELTNFNVEKTKILMSLVFGVLRTRTVPDSNNRKNLVRKINPSGGSRHPSEGYLFNLSIEGLEKGIYHYSSITSTLDYLKDIPSNPQLRELFPGLYRAPFEPQAFIVITSVFERNMYRYREPRTFRTIFMDVGHIIENIDKICNYLGLDNFQHQGIEDRLVESILDINYLEEGAIMGIAVGGKNDKK